MLESGNEKAAVSLRHWGLADAERLLELYRAHDDLGRQLPALSSLSDAQAAVEHFLPGSEERAIFCLEVNGQAAGLIGLSFEDQDPATGKYDRAWVWYWSAGELRGKGQMKSAVRLVTDWAMDRLDYQALPGGFELLTTAASPGIRRLELGYRLNNPASARVAEYAGFTVEGVERAKFKIGDQLIDAAIAARL